MVLLPILIYDSNNNIKGETVFVVALIMGVIGFIAFQYMIRNTTIRVDENNEARYRAENYERIEENLTSFSEMMTNTDALCENLKLTTYVLPEFMEASYEDLKAQLLERGTGIIEGRGLFTYDTTGYKMLSRLHSMSMINRDISELAIFNQKTGTSIVVASDGRFGALCASIDDMQQIIRIEGDLTGVQDKALLAASPTKYASARLYIARVLNDSTVLLCGLTDSAWKYTLLFDNCGRSYQMEQMILRLPGEHLLYLDTHPAPDALGVTEDVMDSDASILDVGEYTVMKYRSTDPAYQLIAVMSETGATSVVTSELFGWVIMLNILWLLIVTFICCYMLLRVFKPLKKITSQLPVEDDAADSIEKISRVISSYDRQLSSSRLTINEKVDQLRRACLKLLVMDQVPSITPMQMQELGIPALLERFVLITIYPNDGHWTQGDGSAQEISYRSHVTMTTIQELLKPHITDAQVEFFLFEECLLLVVPVTEDGQEHELRSRAENWVMNISVHLNKKLLFGISKVRCGQENFSRAYHDAMRRAALVEERESGRSEDITLNMLLKQNMHMADLVYMERYADAFSCMKEMIETLSKQKSRHLRNQQLSSLLSITYCMLTETNRENAALLEQMNLDANELVKVESEAEALQKWETVLTELENHKDERLHGQFSDEFASIYQYLYAHYRDPEISLSLLAEQFEMSLSTLSREFQKNTGLGFLECLHRMRVDAAKYEIEHSSTPLSEIAEAVGYTNTLTMTRAFKKYLGATPSTFRRKDAP